MLLLVTFAYLILMLPSYGMFIYTSFVDYQSSPDLFAGFYLIWVVGNKTYFTNYAINFYLYVISGQKFRSDLVKLFKQRCYRKQTDTVGRHVFSSTGQTTSKSSISTIT